MQPRAVLTICATLTWAWLASGCGSGALECSDLCDSDGDTRCQGSTVLACTPGASGCLVWEQAMDCADYGLTCDGTADATCTGDCNHQCAPDGATRCAGTVLQTCEPGIGSCLGWADTTDCADAGELCDDPSGVAGCMPDCSGGAPAAPVDPTPPDAAAAVDKSVTSLDWADATAAVAYDVYLGSCPAPAYPDAAFTDVTDSERVGISLDYSTTYCWQVVSLDAEGCYTAGAPWTFTTADCVDTVPGAPQVTSGLTATFPSPVATYTLAFNEPMATITSGNLTWTPTTGTGTLDAVVQADPQTFYVELSGLADGDTYVLTVPVTVTDDCGNPLAAAVDIAIDVTPPIPGGEDCTNPATIYSTNHSVDTNGHDCWNIPRDHTDTAGDHSFTCDLNFGGDGVIEYTTGPGDASLYWNAVISNVDTDGYLLMEITEATCAAPASSLHCDSNWNVLTSTGVVPVQPNTTYYIWIGDAFFNNYRPTINACIWSDSLCADSGPGPPQVTSTQSTILGAPSATYTLQFSEAVANVNLASLTWTANTGTGTLDSVVQISPDTYAVNVSGLSVGDSYTLTVTPAVTDLCGNAMGASVDIQLAVDSVVCNEGGGSCGAPLPLSFLGNVAVHYGNVLPSALGYNTATTHFWSFVATNASVSVLVELEQTDCPDTCQAGGTNGAWAGVGLFSSGNCIAALHQNSLQQCIGSLAFNYTSLTPGNTYLIQLRSDEPAYGPYDYRLTVTR